MRHKVFDRHMSEALKKAGMEQAADHRYDDLEVAKEFARQEGRKHRWVTADNVCYAMYMAGLYEAYQRLGNARGSLFRDDCWRWTGKFSSSERTYAHRNPLRVWEYIGD